MLHESSRSSKEMHQLSDVVTRSAAIRETPLPVFYINPINLSISASPPEAMDAAFTPNPVDIRRVKDL